MVRNSQQGRHRGCPLLLSAGAAALLLALACMGANATTQEASGAAPGTTVSPSTERAGSPPAQQADIDQAQEDGHDRTVVAASGGKIDAITLSSGGLAEISRSVQLHDGQALRVQVPLEQVNDILKSLVVRDPAGTIGSVSLDGLSPVEETFRRLPFSGEDLGSLPDLARDLQGVKVRARSGGRSVEGLVLGVDDPARAADGRHDESETHAPVLSVMQDDGAIQALALGSDATLDVLDPAMRAKIRHAALVSGRGRNDEVHVLDIGLTGTGDRSVGLSYVVPAPVWKTAYRLIANDEGHARLQAWAIIENATGEDWRDVQITLSSGKPVTLSQQLFKRYWHARPEVPVQAQSAQAPRPDSEKGVPAMHAKAIPAPAPMLAARGLRNGVAQRETAQDSIAPSRPQQQAVAVESDTSASYMLPEMVTLAAGKTYTAPFVDARINAERVSLYQAGQQGMHPVVALFLKNDTQASLPPGILTVYDQGGYVGDAQLAGIPKGESRMVSFAGDAKVTVRRDSIPQEEVSKVTVADGVLKIKRVARLVTTYSVTGAADAPRTVIIEHPRRQGWTLSSDALDSTTASRYRLKLVLKAAGQGKVSAVESQARSETFSLVDADADTLMQWSGSAADPETAKQLAHLAELRSAVARAQEALSKTEAELKQAAQDQARIRDNLAAVPAQSELAQRYLTMLATEEDRIGGLRTDANRARADLEKAVENMTAFIKTLA